MAHLARRTVRVLDISKRSNESDLDYHKRIIYGKLVDKTLGDIDYAELAEAAYGQSYSSDVARRMFYGSKKTLDIIESEQLHSSDKSILSELEEKRVELQKERQRLSDQRRETNKRVAFDARWENLQETLKYSIDSLKDLDSVVSCNIAGSDDFSDSEAVVVFSDWHFGMTTDNAFNTYNTEICQRRVNQIVNDASKRIILNRCRKLHIVVLGDLIHGNCHVSARVAAEELAADQLMHASEILAQAIYCLSKCVDETYVYMTYGNHARSVQSKADSIHRDNMERIVPWWLEWRLREHKNIFIVPEGKDEFIFVNACGHDICAAHGDLDSVKNSPKLLTMLFNKRYGKDIEYILLGDKHHRESFEELGVTATICGALCGADDYASERRLYSQPSQQLLIVTPENGVDAEYRLKCN